MVKKHTADDDSESQKRTDVRSPEVCVDYLSYKFDEMDLAASWRVMTKQKKDIVNGIRLENASWRTWAKQRSHLKTISPETLNWLKDSDVTWLYGPLHTVIKSEENDRYAPSENKSSTHDKLGLIHASESLLTENKNNSNNNSNGITTPPPPPTTSTSITPPTTSLLPSLEDHVTPPSSSSKPLKSALKRVTMSDILKRSASELLFDKEYAHQNHQDGHDHAILPTSSSSISLSEANRKVGAFSPSIIATHRQPKLRFNQRVEQYMVISDDDGNSSHNGSLPKVKMTANVSSMFDHHHDRRDSTSSVNSDTTNNTDDDIYNNNNNYNHNHQNHNHNTATTTTTSPSSSTLIKEKKNKNKKVIVKVEEDDDDEDEDEIMIQHHDYQSSSSSLPQRQKQQRSKSKKKKPSNRNSTPPRSIKRIEPTVLKSSSYSDNSVASSFNNNGNSQGNFSTWEEDSDDRRSVHLHDFQSQQRSTTIVNQSIEWEGRPCVVYDVDHSEPDTDFLDDDDWDTHHDSFDEDYMNDDEFINDQHHHHFSKKKVNDDNDDDDVKNDINIKNNDDDDDDDGDDDDGDDDDDDDDILEMNTKYNINNNIHNNHNRSNIPSTSSAPMFIKSSASNHHNNHNNNDNSNPFLAPNILSPGKAWKSQPVSESSPIDALHHSSSTNNIIDRQSSSSSPPPQQQQQQQQSSVLDHISQWASSYFRKSS